MLTDHQFFFAAVGLVIAVCAVICLYPFFDAD